MPPPLDREIAKATFVAEYREGHSMAWAAQKINVTTRTVHAWRQDDEGFDAAVREAYEAQTEVVEDCLWKLIRAGNIAAIIFFLKTRRGLQGQRFEPDAEVTVAELIQQAKDDGLIPIEVPTGLE